MVTSTQKRVSLMRTPTTHRVGVIAAFLAVVVTVALGILAATDNTAHAAPASTLNYQARLKMGSGALPPDGYYNLEFKLHTAVSGGTAVWTEAYTAGSRIRVANGYVSVQLGSQSPFSTASPAIDWGQEMWLTMNVGGMDPTVPDWDGEMSPRLKLTSVPYAFKAEQAKTLQTTDGANTSTLGWQTQTASRSILLPDEDVAGGNIVCLRSSVACGFAPATGGTGYIQNGTVAQPAPANFNIDGTGKASTLNATTSLQLNGADINTAGTLSNVAYLNQVTTFKATTDSAAAFRVQNAAGTATVLNVDTVGGSVGVGTQSTTTTLARLTDLSPQPAGAGRGAAYSPDSTYLAVAHWVSPYLTIYKRSGGTYSKLPDLAVGNRPTGNAYLPSFTEDGQYLAVAHHTSPFVTIYKRSGDTFTKLANPSSLPTGNSYSTSFSSDGRYLAVGHDVSPYLTIYKRSGDTFTKLQNPAETPTGIGWGATFSKDGTYLAVAHPTAPALTIYKRSGDTFTKLPNGNISALPTTNAYGAAWSPDGQYLVVDRDQSPYFTFYKRTGDTFTAQTSPGAGNIPTGTGDGPAFSPDGRFMAIAHNTAPFMTVYQVGPTGVLSKIANPVSQPAGWGYNAVFSPDSQNLTIISDSAPYVINYKIGDGTAASLSVAGNVSVAGQVVANSLIATTVTGGTATFGTLSATNANVQSEAISGGLTVATSISLAASNTSPGLLKLGIMNSVSDPVTGSNGMMYYNSSMDEFRCYTVGAWGSCGGALAIGSGSFSQGGNNFGGTAVLGTTDNNDLNIVANAATLANFGADGNIAFSPTGNLNVQNSTGADIMRVDTVNNTVSLGSLDGTTGWASMTALPTAMGMGSVSSFVYDGRLYMTGPTFGYRTIMGELNGADVTSWSVAAANFYAEAEWNGYAYDIDTNGGVVSYAKINVDGQIGSSFTAPALPITGSDQAEYNMLAHDGYLYVIKSDGIMVAKLGVNGSVGAWQVVSGADAGGTPYDSRGARVAVAQNRLYTVGGGFSGGPESQTVAYATLNGDGTFGAWAYATDLPDEFVHGGLYAYGNSLYAYTNSGVVYRGAIGASGNITTWEQAGFGVPGSAPYYNAAVELDASTGYVYVAGRGSGSTAAYSRQMGGAATIDGSLAVDDGLAVMGGPTILQGTIDVAGVTTVSNNLQVQNSSGEDVLNVNAELGIVTVGPGGDFTGGLLGDSAPSELPGGNAVAVDWSGSGTYLAVGTQNSQYLTIYKRSGDTLSKLSSSPAYSNPVRSVDWSNDDTYLAVGSQTSNPNRLTVYKRSSNDIFTALSVSVPGNGVVSVAWSPNSSYLAVGTASAPYLTIYKRSGDTLTALTSPNLPTPMPAGYVASVRWSPDSTYLTVGQYNGSQGTLGYKRSGDAFTSLGSSATINFQNFAQAWSPDGNYWAVGGYDAAGTLEVWRRVGDTLTGSSLTIDVQPGGAMTDVEWSPDGRYLMVGREVTGGGKIAIYGLADGQLTLLTGTPPSPLPGNNVYDMDFSPDGEKLAVASFLTTSSRFTVYDSTLGYDGNGNLVVGSMITADALTLGSPAAASLASAKLVTARAEIQTALRLGNATSGISFNDITTGSGGGKLRYYGDSRNLKTVTLVPEYAGAVLDGTGTGTMSSAVDGDRPHYQWLSSSGTSQSYAVTVTLALPSDWSEWDGGDDICVDSFTSNITTGSAQLYVLNSSSGAVDVNGPTITPSTASVWDTRCYSLTPGNGYSADGVITLRLIMTSHSSASVRLGDITLSYLSSF
jgi:WD40 repeat protein